MSKRGTESERPPRSGFLIVGCAVVGTLALVAVLAPILAPHDPRAFTGDALEAPSARHWLGTNDLGQDIASELIWGARSSLVVAVAAATLTMAIAVILGAGGGLVGGVVDQAIGRLIDMWLAMPMLPLLMLVGAIAGGSRVVMVVTMALLAWPASARIVRAQALVLRQHGFVRVARGLGGGPLYVLRRHLVPALGPIIVTGFVTVAGIASVLEAGLAFLGIGDPAGVSWGHILNRALTHQGVYLSGLWMWWVLPAGVAVSLAVLGFTFVGVGLEPRLNPRWRRMAP